MDIVIYCPHKIHKKPFYKLVDNEHTEITPKNPKILLIASENAVGRFKVQCGDHRHRKVAENKGWMEVVLNGRGGYEVNELPKEFYDVQSVPCVVGQK